LVLVVQLYGHGRRVHDVSSSHTGTPHACATRNFVVALQSPCGRCRCHYCSCRHTRGLPYCSMLLSDRSDGAATRTCTSLHRHMAVLATVVISLPTAAFTCVTPSQAAPSFPCSCDVHSRDAVVKSNQGEVTSDRFLSYPAPSLSLLPSQSHPAFN